MKHFFTVLFCLVLVSSLTFGGSDRQKEKSADGRLLGSPVAMPAAGVLGTNDWATFDIESATSYYKGIEVLPGGVVWIAGLLEAGGDYYGYRSVDGGTSWRKFTITVPFGATGVTNIAAKDSNIAVIGTDNGYLIRTTNGGATWDSVCSYVSTGSQYEWMDGVKCVGATGDTMIAYGDADQLGVPVFRSFDAGATWTRLTNLPATDSVLTDGWYAGYYTFGQGMESYGTTVWITLYWGGGWDPRILKSTDAGTTWSVITAHLPGGNAYDTYLRSINFKDENIGYGVAKGLSSSSTYWMVRTSDGGVTWSDTINVEPGVTHSNAKPATVKPIRGTNSVFAGGFGTAGAKAWWSTDGGTTWTNLGIPFGPSNLAMIINAAFYDELHGFAVGQEINVMLTPSTGVEETPLGQPVEYVLGQNYPNPFNPTTTIDYSIPRAGNVDLKVYNLLGQEVATLAHGMHSAGHFSVVFDAKGLSSGVYFYTLRAGNVVRTKTLVLVR